MAASVRLFAGSNLKRVPVRDEGIGTSGFVSTGLRDTEFALAQREILRCPLVCRYMGKADERTLGCVMPPGFVSLARIAVSLDTNLIAARNNISH